jgi:hypothetical protein
VRLRGNVGVILDASGAMDPTQLMANAGQMVAQLKNSELKDKQQPGKFAVWFPMQYLGSIGVSTPQSFPGGAYLSFNTLAEAQAHAQQRGNVGVLIDPDGSFDAAQVWPAAGQFAAQRLNSQIQPQLTAGKWNVWFPAAIFPNLGFAGGPSFQGGGYLAFNSQQEALDHVKQRGNIGVTVDDQGRIGSTQVWPQAFQYTAQNPNLKPAPPSGWINGPNPADAATIAQLGGPTEGSVAVMSTTPTKTGADVVVHVGWNGNPPPAFHVFIGAQLNGSWLPIYSIPDNNTLPSSGWSQFTLHLDYAAMEAYLKGVNPSLGVQPNMNAAIGITFGNGHRTGMPGWSSNVGTEREAHLQLPAKLP